MLQTSLVDLLDGDSEVKYEIFMCLILQNVILKKTLFSLIVIAQFIKYKEFTFSLLQILTFVKYFIFSVIFTI